MLQIIQSSEQTGNRQSFDQVDDDSEPQFNIGNYSMGNIEDDDDVEGEGEQEDENMEENAVSQVVISSQEPEEIVYFLSDSDSD